MDGISNTYSDTTEPGLETIDQLGLRLATLANANTGIDAIYNDSTNEIVLESIEKIHHSQLALVQQVLAQAIKITSSKYNSNYKKCNYGLDS